MNLFRVRYLPNFSDLIPQPFLGLRILNIGYGDGLICKPLSRLGATLVGADDSAEALLEDGETFELVCAMEVTEHVADPANLRQHRPAKWTSHPFAYILTIFPCRGYVETCESWRSRL